MVDRGCDVFSFDPDPATIPKQLHPTRHTFFPLGISNEASSHPRGTIYSAAKVKHFVVLPLEQIMEMLGHSHLSLIRTDVEGAEWDFLPSWYERNSFSLFDQWLVEAHKWVSPSHMDTPAATWSVLKPKYDKLIADVPMEFTYQTENGYGRGHVHEMGFIQKRLTKLFEPCRSAADPGAPDAERSIPTILHYTNSDDPKLWPESHKNGTAVAIAVQCPALPTPSRAFSPLERALAGCYILLERRSQHPISVPPLQIPISSR